MSTYDSLRRECRTLESLLDTKLASYARLASTIGREPADVEASGSADRWSDLEEEVDGLLEKVCSTCYLSFHPFKGVDTDWFSVVDRNK